MKAKRNTIVPEKPKFEPFELVLTVETKEEARALYAIFNYAPNTQILPDASVPDSIRAQIGGKYGVISDGEVIANKITYREFYQPKVKN